MTAVHQFHPVLAPADAMSNHVFALRKRIRGWGYESYAYAVEAKAGVADVRSYRRLFREVKPDRSEEHTSELQSRQYLVCRLLLEKKKKLGKFLMHGDEPTSTKGPHLALASGRKH